MYMLFDIRKKVADGLFEFSKHAVDQSIIREINIDDLVTVIMNGEMIEDYPDDKYVQSCLIFGLTSQNRAIHVQISYPSRPLLEIITLYAVIAQKFVILTRNIKVQRPNILSWTSALRTSVTDVISDGNLTKTFG